MATEIDVLCYGTVDTTKHAGLVVVEIKTTQYTAHEHLESYNGVDYCAPHMRNGLPNSLYWHHQMQLAAMTRTLKECYSPRSPIHGIVLVSCADRQVSI